MHKKGRFSAIARSTFEEIKYVDTGAKRDTFPGPSARADKLRT